MMTVRLPDTLRPLILRIGITDDATFNAVSAALDSMPATVDKGRIVRHAVAACQGLDEREVRSIAEGALGLRSLFAYQNSNEREFIAGLLVSLESKKGEASGGFDAGAFSVRSERLLQSKALGISAKALQLLFESRRHIVGSRVLTDIRPIFGDNATEAPIAAIVTHTLRLQFHEADRNSELFFSLDRQDVATLVEALRRAIEKEDSLNEYFDNKGLQIIESAPK